MAEPTNQQITDKVDALADKVDALATVQTETNAKVDALHETMMRELQYVIREIHRVEEGGPRPNESTCEYPCPIRGCDHVLNRDDLPLVGEVAAGAPVP